MVSLERFDDFRPLPPFFLRFSDHWSDQPIPMFPFVLLSFKSSKQAWKMDLSFPPQRKGEKASFPSSRYLWGPTMHWYWDIRSIESFVKSWGFVLNNVASFEQQVFALCDYFPWIRDCGGWKDKLTQFVRPRSYMWPSIKDICLRGEEKVCAFETESGFCFPISCLEMYTGNFLALILDL